MPTVGLVGAQDYNITDAYSIRAHLSSACETLYILSVFQYAHDSIDCLNCERFELLFVSQQPEDGLVEGCFGRTLGGVVSLL